MNMPSFLRRPHHLLMNPLSLLGVIIGTSGFISAIFLLVFDFLGTRENPYLGIFTFLVAPTVMMTGLVLTTVGALRMRRRLRSAAPGAERMPVIDLNNPSHFRTLVYSIVGGLMLIGVSAVGTYRSYHFSESVSFCGKTCHQVMKPEYTAFHTSPHANVQCTTCHIGPGADWFVKSKINGLKQVWNTALDRYPRPIATPIHNLRPAKETCYTCHWPSKFFGSVLMQRTYFLPDDHNTPWTVQMLVHVGGGDSAHGGGQGIHWHMVAQNKIEYFAADEKRLTIPWVRQTMADGSVRVYKTKDTNFVAQADALDKPDVLARTPLRTMDCIDCHNRPTHRYESPERAVNEAMTAGFIDASLDGVKARAVELLNGEYKTEPEALAAIASGMRETYTEKDDRVDHAISRLQRIYSENFFPEMRVNWKAYPDNIGHMITPGCFRCHDGQHVSEDGSVIRKDCTICHTILAQGKGREPAAMTSKGLKFEHPDDVGDRAETDRCDDCHDGTPVL